MRTTPHSTAAALLTTALLASPALAASALNVHVDDVAPNGPILASYAMCKAIEGGKSGPSDNQRPTISWSGAPASTQSFVVLVSDPDVPADLSKAGKDGETIAVNAKRQTFYHWGVINIPAAVTSLSGGKTDAPLSAGTPVANDLGAYLPDAKTYGGPCPPWNDARVHHYHFQVFALDVGSLGDKPLTTAKEVAATLKKSPHVLAKGEVVGTYTLNQALHAGLPQPGHPAQ